MVKAVETKAPSLNLRQYEKESALIWSINNIALPKGAQWDFTHRAWQVDIFDDKSEQISIIKPTQVGITTIMLCKVLHFAAYQNGRVMYTLPRQDDVTDLVNVRVMEIFNNSPLLESYVGEIDNIRLKKFGGSFLHFMESSVTPRMLDVDYLVNDEVDMSDQDNLDQYAARLDASIYQIHHKLSTPTIHSFGIHAEYEKSDKKRWLVKCPRCNTEQEMDWDLNSRAKNDVYWYACNHCDRKFDPEIIQNGRWVAEYPGRFISGYAISQLMSTYISPSKIAFDKANMKPKNFANLRLGQPYSPTTGSISRQSIYDNCFVSQHSMEPGGDGYFMGVDQGNDLHVAIAKKEDGFLKIVRLEIVDFEDGFNRVAQLMKEYGISCCVMDGLPNRHPAYQVATAFPPGRVLLAFFSEATGSMYKSNDQERKVVISKTDAYDNLREMITESKIQLYGSRGAMDKITTTAIDHLANMRRDEYEQKTKAGGVSRRSMWVNVGADHFADAIMYMTVAADIRGNASFTAREIGTKEVESRNFLDEEPLPINPYARQSVVSGKKRRPLAV